jgi:TonB family protein
MWSCLTSIARVVTLISAVGTLFAQSLPNQDADKKQVVLTELFPPVYPPLARQTHIVGRVQLELKIRPDGSVDSLEVVSGHPLLAQAALDSAKQSHFRCTDCGEGLFSYRLAYTFQFAETEDCCNAAQAGFPKVSQSANHITVVESSMRTCDPTETITKIKVRSIKCLYLWHCSVRYPA